MSGDNVVVSDDNVVVSDDNVVVSDDKVKFHIGIGFVLLCHNLLQSVTYQHMYNAMASRDKSLIRNIAMYIYYAFERRIVLLTETLVLLYHFLIIFLQIDSISICIL